jgi:hypothetical protein
VWHHDLLRTSVGLRVSPSQIAVYQGISHSNLDEVSSSSVPWRPTGETSGNLLGSGGPPINCRMMDELDLRGTSTRRLEKG